MLLGTHRRLCYNSNYINARSLATRCWRRLVFNDAAFGKRHVRKPNAFEKRLQKPSSTSASTSVLALCAAELQDCSGSTLLPATELAASDALTSVEPRHCAPQALDELGPGLDSCKRGLLQTQPQSIPPSLDGIEVRRMLWMIFERDAASCLRGPHAFRA